MSGFFEAIFFQPLFNALVLLTVWLPGHSLGWAIIVLTLIIRALLISSAAQSIRHQHKLQQLQPELKKVQEEHKDNREKQAAEILALYKKYDIHPIGSCVPMLIQLPVLISLFYVFRSGIDSSHFDALYSFVTRPETVQTLFFGIDLASKSILLAVLAGVLQFIQTRMLMTSSYRHKPEPGIQSMIQNQMLYFMPVLTVVIALGLPAALALYWVITTLFSIVQQYFLFRTLSQPVRLDAVSVTPSRETSVASVPETSVPRGDVKVTIRKKGA